LANFLLEHFARPPTYILHQIVTIPVRLVLSSSNASVFHTSRAMSRERQEADVADQLECGGAARHIPAQQRRSPRVNAGVGGSRNLQGRGRTQLAASTSREQKKNQALRLDISRAEMAAAPASSVPVLCIS
jgi:hypothetical protein